MDCRHCDVPLKHIFLDLGFAPPSNAFLTAKQLHEPEPYFPLKIYVCDSCWLVQTEDYVRAGELFRHDYAYFSSVSETWLDHAARYTTAICDRLRLGGNSFVVEIASNDGYLLRNFVAAGIPCLGIEPTADTATAAEALGIPVSREFFDSAVGKRLAANGKQADLIIGNNVYAHVPDINDFTAGLKTVLKPAGTITLEFPHLKRLIEHAQFDTTYHEHFSYLSLYATSRMFERAGLRIFDVEELPTHGGSLRVYGCHVDDARPISAAVDRVISEEVNFGLRKLATYLAFQPKANRVKDDLLAFLIEKKKLGKKIAAYGAAAKGNTLLNYAGVKPDLLPYVCDAALSKQGKYLPGSHIPVLPPATLQAERPDFVLILPWNISKEVMDQQKIIRQWGGKFVVGVPSLSVLE